MKNLLTKVGIYLFAGLFIFIRIAGVLSVLVGSFLCLGAVVDYFGIVVTVIGVFLLPATLAIVPWYDAVAYGNWLPLILVYGGGFVAGITNQL